MTISFEDLYENQSKVLDNLPFPVYCSELNSGVFRYVNKPLADFLGQERSDLCNSRVLTAASLFPEANDRFDWTQKVRRAGNNPTIAVYEIMRPVSVKTLLPQEQRLSEGSCAELNLSRLFVADFAVMELHQNGDGLVLGVLVDVTKWMLDLELQKRRVSALKDILDNSAIGFGVHQVDGTGRIAWLNRKAREMYGIQEKELHGHPVVELSRSDRLGKMTRVFRKLLGTHPMTLGEHRTFVTQTRKESSTIPVNIHDFPVASPDPQAQKRDNHEIFTIVHDERIEPDIRHYLMAFGPRNPMLNLANVAAFRKIVKEHLKLGDADDDVEVRPDLPDHSLVFTYGNKLFLEELSKIGSATAVRGQIESDLFPEFVDSFMQADQSVLDSKQDDERIEKHPDMNGGDPISVQVFKAPVREPNGKVIGVEGFYWPANEQKQVFERIRKGTEPNEILENIPVPIYRKNIDLEFIYANKAYLLDVDRSLRDVIGRRDTEIFAGQLDENGQPVAEKYERDDLAILEKARSSDRTNREYEESPHRHLDQIELHNGKLVRVIKTVVRDVDGGLSGLQGVFWILLDDERRPNRPVWIDWRSLMLHVYGHPPTRIQHKQDEHVWPLFEELVDYTHSKKTNRVPFDHLIERVYGEKVRKVDRKLKRDKLRNVAIRLNRVLVEKKLGQKFDVCLAKGGNYVLFNVGTSNFVGHKHASPNLRI